MVQGDASKLQPFEATPRQATGAQMGQLIQIMAVGRHGPHLQHQGVAPDGTANPCIDVPARIEASRGCGQPEGIQARGVVQHQQLAEETLHPARGLCPGLVGRPAEMHEVEVDAGRRAP